jgi:APA family basic amino acid/polyamine antiporter
MASEETERRIGLFYGVIAGLGSTLGIEFFVLLDYATELAGPGIVISLVLAGLLNLLIMFNYAELSSSISMVGAEYTFTKAAFGGFICFLSGGLRWLSSVFTTTLSAMGLAELVHLFLPQLDASLVAVVLIAVFAVISVKGGRTVDLMTVLSFVLVFVLLGVLSVIHGLNFGNFEPLMAGFHPGVLAGAMYSFSMYVGMRAIATKSPEMKEPGKVLPMAVLLSTAITIIVYCGVAFVAIGVVPPDHEPSGFLLIHVADVVMGPAGKLLVAIAMTSAALMSLATSMSVQTSILSALSRDGYLPWIIFSPGRGSITRYVAQMIGSVLAILLAATGLIVFVGYAAGFASLLVFAFVNLSLIKLRMDRPDLDRPFKTPLYPYTPIIGIAIALALILFVESSAVTLVLEFIIMLLIVYHLKMMGYRRLRVAIGGINMGISGFIVLIVSLVQTGAVQLGLSPQEHTALLIIGFVLAATFFTAGVLNLVKSEKAEAEAVGRLWVE